MVNIAYNPVCQPSNTYNNDMKRYSVHQTHFHDGEANRKVLAFSGLAHSLLSQTHDHLVIGAHIKPVLQIQNTVITSAACSTLQFPSTSIAT